MGRVRELAVFCRKMQRSLEAGFDLERALLIVQEETQGSLKAVIRRTGDAVGRGKQLHQAMRQDEQSYTPELVNAVYVTEQTGHFALAFGRMAERFERKDSTRRKIMQAGIYPAIVLLGLVIALIVTVRVLGHVPPMLAITAAILLGFGAIVCVAVFAYGLGNSLSRDNLSASNLLIKIPFFGKLIMKEDLADLAGNLSVFYACGIPADQALSYSARSVQCEALRDKVLKAAEDTKRGNLLSEALAAQEVFPADLINAIRTGEASGTVDDMLLTVERYYRREIQNRIDIFMTIIRQ